MKCPLGKDRNSKKTHVIATTFLVFISIHTAFSSTYTHPSVSPKRVQGRMVIRIYDGTGYGLDNDREIKTRKRGTSMYQDIGHQNRKLGCLT